MLYGIVPASLQDIVEADHVALDVGIRILDGIPYASLSRKVALEIFQDVVRKGAYAALSLDEKLGLLFFVCSYKIAL